MNVPADFDDPDTLQYTITMISDSTVDVQVDGSNDKDNIMPKNRAIPSKAAFFDMISSLPLEVWIGTSMMLSEIVILAYYEVSESSKSVGTCISSVNLCKYCVNRASALVPNFGTKCTT